MFYYPPSPSQLLGSFAVRYGKYKAHFFTQGVSHGCHHFFGIARDGDPRSAFLEAPTFYTSGTVASSPFLCVFPGAFHSDTTPDVDCHGLTLLAVHEPPLLFDLDSDPAENYNLLKGGALHPFILDVLKEARMQKALFDELLVFGKSQTGRGTDPKLEPCCSPQCRPKPWCCRCVPGLTSAPPFL